MISVRSRCLLATAALLLPVSMLQAQTLGVVEQRIDRLEKSVRELQSRRGGGKVVPAEPAPVRQAPGDEAIVALGGRLASLERSVAALLATQEQDRRTLSTGIDRLERLKGDVDSRLEAVEQQVTALANAPKPAPVVAQPAKADTPEDRYLEALGFADKGEWAKAEFAFDTFVTNNPNHPRIVEARYWLGRSFLGEGKAPQAAQVFLELYEKHPDAPVALDNLFALAEALVAIGPDNAAQACAVYDQIDAGFAAKLSAIQRNRLLDLRVKQNCK